MGNTSINRDVKHHGPRLQRLRALCLILDISKEKKDKAHFYFGIENQGDVRMKSDEAGKKESYHEEDKNYDPESLFTINSIEIKKALVGFLDTWFEKSLSNNCYFAFYATNNIGKDGMSDLIRNLNLTLPDEPILEILESKSWDSRSLKLLAKLTIGIYEEEYKNKVNNGNLEAVKNLSDEIWLDFFKNVSFQFGQPNQEELEGIVLSKIQESRFYDSRHTGKENLLKSCLLDLIDERHISDDPTENLIHLAEVNVIFHDVAGREKDKSEDIVYKQWDKLIADTDDTRNLKDKIDSVTNKISQSKITNYSILAATGHLEKEEYDSIKNFQSLRYRIFEICFQKISKFKRDRNITELTDNHIDELHEFLLEESYELVQSLSQDFAYSFNSKPVINGIIYQLIDSCFLSYDEFK